MKKRLLKMLAVLLSAILLAGMLPATGLAADDELVISQIHHVDTDTVTITTPTQRDITLTVPFSYGFGTLDLSAGLNITPAAGVDYAVASWGAGSTATITDHGNPISPVVMTVTYRLTGDAEDTTTYNVSVVRAERVDPSFTGTVAKTPTAALPHTITFAQGDFTSKYTQNDGAAAIDSIAITGSNPIFGTLKIGGADYNLGDDIVLGDIATLTFVASGAGHVQYLVNADAGADTDLGPVILDITVTAITAPTGLVAINKNIGLGAPNTYTFVPADFVYNNNNGTAANTTITITSAAGSTGTGTWADGLPATYTVAEITNGDLTFQGDGAGTVLFTYTVTNEAGPSAASATCTMTVAAAGAPTFTGTGAIAKSIYKNAMYKFTEADFTSQYDLHYGSFANIAITFPDPASAAGTWKYNNNPVAAGSTLTINSEADLAKLTFTGSAAGTAAVNWSVTNSVGTLNGGTCTITVTNAAVSIPYTGTAGSTVQFTQTTASTNLNTICQSATASSLAPTGTVTYTAPAASYGTLRYNYVSAASPGTAIAAGATYTCAYSNLTKMAFVPASAVISSVNIGFTGTSATGCTFPGTVNITYNTAVNITYSTPVNTPVTFSDFYAQFHTASGQYLNYLAFTSLPVSTNGTLYRDYATYGANATYSVTTGTTLYGSTTSPLINNVAFVPYTGYTGTVTFNFTAITTGGLTVTGTVTITVGTGSGISYTTAVNTPVTFSDFTSQFYAQTGKYLNYLKFTTIPATTNGTLYRDYAAHGANAAYAVTTGMTLYGSSSSPLINGVAFVPYTGYTGTVTLYYSAYTTAGTTVTGTVTIIVGSAAGITFTTAVNTPVTFTDFYTQFYTQTGKYLNYLKFTSLPAASAGTLYRDYAAYTTTYPIATTTTLYGSSPTPLINKVAFVPYTGYTGTVTLYYTAVTTAGTTVTGTVTVNVGSTGDVTYTTAINTPKTFSASDFYSACTSKTSQALNYVTFSSVTNTYGKLYVNYNPSSSSNPYAVAGTRYYYNTTPSIGSITFVPTSNYTGTASFAFTGVSTGGKSFTGTVTITITGGIENIEMTIDEDTATAFYANSFSSAFKDGTGSTLSYVKFTLPSASYGRLFYQYTGDPATSTAVSANTAYKTSGTPSLSYVSFLPAANYVGTVTLNYTAYDASNNSSTGKVVISVLPVAGSAIFDDVDAKYDWAADAIDYLYQAGIVKGTGTTTYSPAANISRGDFILMLYRALGFSGTPSKMFTDVPSGSYYYTAIAAAKAAGIAEGSGDKFNPDAPLTRQDAMVLIYRALKAVGQSLPDGTSSNLSGYNDTNKISSYALTAVATLVKAGIIKGNNGQINPLGNMTRAEMAVVIFRII